MQKSLMGNLWATVGRFPGRLLLACLMVIISNGLLVISPLVFRQALLVMGHQNEPSILGAFFEKLLGHYVHAPYAWALLLLMIAVVSAVLKYGMRIIFFAISRKAELEMRAMLFDRIQSQSRAFFDQHNIGDLLSRLSNDITAYRDVLGPGLMYPMFFLSLVVPALCALFYLSPAMALISILPIIGIYCLNAWVSRPMLDVSHRLQKLLADMSRMTHEHYSGIKLIKSYGIERTLAVLFEGLCHLFSQLNTRFALYQGLFFPSLSLIVKLTTLGLTVGAGGIVLLDWGPALSLADFLSFIWIQSFVFGPLLMLAWVVPMYHKGKAAYARLLEIYEAPLEIYQAAQPIQHIPVKASIEFRHLHFAYPRQERSILSDLNLTIEGGTFVGITGPVGAGKTTLFRLLSREYEVPQGTILIGGEEIHAYSLDAFYQQMVTVEQLPFLFSATIRDNIKFGKQDAAETEMQTAAVQADLHQDVTAFPLQYDTPVGERGVSLSGGQKQRLAIARAFLVNRSILLLDDIFSALDAATEKKVFEALKVHFRGKTVLLITHRVSILEQLDRIVYLREGRIQEDGTPLELSRRDGFYSALVGLQKLRDSHAKRL